MTVQMLLSAWRKVLIVLVYSLTVTTRNSPGACSKFKVKVFEPYPDAFIWCTLEHVAAIDISGVRLWISWTAERASLPARTAVNILTRVICSTLINVNRLSTWTHALTAQRTLSTFNAIALSHIVDKSLKVTRSSTH